MLVEFDNPALDGFGGADFLHLIEICAELSKSDAQKKLLPQIAKDRSIKIVATRSNAQLLSSELATMLTGRHSSHEMTPLSFKEILSVWRISALIS